MGKPAAVAKRAIGLLDLTNLDDRCDESAVAQLCRRAQTPFGPVAAVCLWSRFLGQAADALKGTPIKLCTVANFPGGQASIDHLRAEIDAALADGADEVDVVMPYGALLAGDRVTPARLIGAARAAVPTNRVLKVIIESGALRTDALIGEASRMAIQGGADFIKTSTGKIDVSATLAAAEVMMTEINRADRPVGFKASGGLRSTDDVAAYLALADRIMGPDWADSQRFRLGASSLLDDLLANAG